MAGLSNSTLSILSSTYYDDYDDDKRFHRILFRPSVALQARELTQLQTILQTQISRFGSNIFKDGGIVEGVSIKYHESVPYISLTDNFNTNTNLTVIDFTAGTLVTNGTDSNTAVRAAIKISKQGYIPQYPNTNRLYLDYIVTGSDDGGNDVNQFSPGDTLYFYNTDQSKFGTLIANNLIDSIETLASNATFTSDGYAYCVSVSDGVIFQKGHFIKVQPQTITVKDYDTDVDGYVVGFETTETIVRETQDTSLYDNALGYSNANAPGAHRLKLTPTLISKPRSETTNPNFFAIAEFDDTAPTEQKKAADSYNMIQSSIDRSRYEESGDYVVNPFRIDTYEDPNSTQFFTVDISSGKGYVRGSRIEKIGSTAIPVRRATETREYNNKIVTANFGTYVICDEFLGVFDYETLSTVTLYDQPQNAISTHSGISSAAIGNAVGTAKVKAVTYDGGTKGLPEATYQIFLFNIQMNSNKTFTSDVKSLYVNGTFGKAKADIVLENDQAILKDTARNSLLFNIGINNVKRLTNSAGTGDTSFIYNQISSGSLLTSGSATFNLESPAPGGAEVINSSVGTLSAGALNDYNVYVSSNAYSANLTGTLVVSSGSYTILANNTTDFTNELVVGDLIRIDVGASQFVRRVTSISSSTSLQIDATIGSSNNNSYYQKFFLEGSPLPLSSIDVTTSTQFVANLGYTINTTTPVYATYPVYRTNATPISKVINKNRFVKIDCSNNSANSVGPWVLGLPDIANIRHIYVGTTYDDTNPDQPSWFSLDTGQRDDVYGLGSISIKPAFRNNINGSTKLLVELDHFTSNTTTGVGFFSVDSYPVNDEEDTINSIRTVDIPYYRGADLRNIIDIRPVKANTAISSTTIAGASINPIDTNTIDIPSTGQHIAYPNSNYTLDLEAYLPRIDCVTLNSQGNFNVVEGVSDTNPRSPFVSGDQSIIAEVYVPGYPSITARELENFSPTVDHVRVTLKTNRRYTMKDIGALEERIKRLEYYTVLNTIEQQARDLTVPDANGLDRFKNGIFADPFTTQVPGNTLDTEYRISIDPLNSVALPFFREHFVDFKYANTLSSGVRRTGNSLTLNYNNEDYISQPFATKYRNATESVWQYNGRATLYPAVDVYRDTTRPAALQQSATIDLTGPFQQLANSAFGTVRGDWRTESSVTSTEFVSGGTALPAGGGMAMHINVSEVTTTETQSRIVSTLNVGSTNNSISTGEYVSNIQISPYLRSRVIAFNAVGLRPRTRVYPYFDSVSISADCAPGILSSNTVVEEGREENRVSINGSYGDPLITDENGSVSGLFRIPEARFRTGDREFLLTNVNDLVTGADARMMNATARFTGDSVVTQIGSTTINTINPNLSVSSNTEFRTVNTTTQEVSAIPFWFEPPDPLAQSFTVDNLPDGEGISGIFVTRATIYFKSKSSDVGCDVYLVEMTNNTPDTNKILGYSSLNPNDISISDDASVGTTFTFENPIYLLSGVDYAIVVQPIGNSPDYNVWVAETGDYDVVTGQQVFSNPSSGLLFTSSNRKSWTAYQTEDMKFTLSRARFTTSSGYGIFNNETDEYLTIDGFIRESANVGPQIGDVVYNVNSTSNSTITDGSEAFGIIQNIDETTGQLALDSSTGNFSNTVDQHIRVYRVTEIGNTSQIASENLIAYANVVTVDNKTYHQVVPKFAVMIPSKTRLQYQFKGTKIDNVADTNYVNVNNNYEREFIDVGRNISSRTNEINNLSGNSSAEFKISLNSDSTYVSPVIDLRVKAALFIENIINDDATNEHLKTGNAETKYISKTVVLADGQEAEDLKVYITANKPGGTNIKVYAKFWNNQDSESFDSKMWTLLQYDNGGEYVYTSSNPYDYREYEFSVPSSTGGITYAAFANTGNDTYTPIAGTVQTTLNSTEIVGSGTDFTTSLAVDDEIRIRNNNNEYEIKTVVSIANATHFTVDSGMTFSNSATVTQIFQSNSNDGIVEYNNTSNSRFIGFKKFAIKIVLLSENAAVVPRLNDLRALALQV